ncbi:MAG: EAL domain-containing protein, partial [Pseudomonadales bacterium]|nr:EAL domain-containing protein [Pseudomonadales bacterium]
FDLTIQELLKKHQLPASQLLLEVTETSMMNDTARCLNMLQKLNHLGTHLSVDDFGTGQSSLAYIKRLPVHEIKIDRSFVMEMDSNGEDATIVNTTINMCHSLNYKVVAEGVENVNSCAMLKQMGCDSIQGYYISRPISAKKFDEWLMAKAWQPLLEKMAS